MKIVFLIVVILHGLIHLLGFIKAYGIKEVKELTLPISKPMGLVRLSATVLFVIYGIMYIANADYDWAVGLIAVVISQVLVILYWKDAKFGTIANMIILLVLIDLLG